MIKILNLLVIIITSAFILQGCVGSDRTNIKTEDPDKAFEIAKSSYDKGDYLQAIDDFTLIKVKFSGTNISDKSQYYLGMSYLKREEYILAAYEFEYLLKNYATSSYSVEGRFQLAMCYYGLSPKYSLDQTYTVLAINEFKNFLELYPADKNSPAAESKIKELRNKLAYKELKSAELYVKMDNLKASIVTYDHIISEYFDTDYADDAMLGKIRSLIARKKYEEARKEIAKFESKFSNSDLLEKVKKLKSSL